MRLFVFSTLPSYHALSGSELRVPHCDSKGEPEDYAAERGLPATFVRVAFYHENFRSFFPLRPQADGGYALGFPKATRRSPRCRWRTSSA